MTFQEMTFRRLGKSSLVVSSLGLGCMGMSEFYGPPDDPQSIATLHRAVDLGVTFIDTADIYGIGRNEELVGKAITGRRNRVIVATKFGNLRSPQGAFLGVNGRPEYVQAACEASLRRLMIATIDLYYQHRVDSDVPIEETVGAMARLIEQGKVRYLGLSEAGPQTIRRAHAVYPTYRAANRILALDARPRRRNPRDVPRTWNWICCLQPAGPRNSYRPLSESSGFSFRGFSPESSAIFGRQL